MNWPRFPILAIASLVLFTLPSLPERLSFEVSASASTEARPGAYTDYRFDEPGPFSNLDIFVKWTLSPSDAYIYPAFTFSFEAGQGGYMGTQIVGTRKTAIFSLWDISFEAISAEPNHSNCQRFGQEGTGTSCIMTYNWSTGREYRLRIWAAGSDSTGQNWQATILDVESGQETTIGVIHLKNSKGHEGYGKLTNRPAIFLEYFGGPETCEGQPYAKVTWRGPHADWDTFAATQALVSYPHDVWTDLVPCGANNVASLACPVVTHEGGGTTQLTTPSGTDVWSGKSCPDPGELPPTPTRTPTATPSPTPSPTPTPPAEPTRTLDWGSGWHNATWTGTSTPEEAFACADGSYAAAYRLVDGGFERYFPDRPQISNMGDLEQYAAFLILITEDITCQMPVADPPGTERTLDWGAGWQSDGWTGPDGTSPEDAFACADGSYAAAYRYVGGAFERYFPDRPEISNMGPLNQYDPFLILVTAPVSCSMPIAP